MATPQKFSKKYEILLAAAKREFKNFKIKHKSKSKWLWLPLHYGLRTITFGKHKGLLEGYHTTIGQTIYVADGWDNYGDFHKYELVRHETQHMRDNMQEGYIRYVFGYLFSKKYRAWIEKRGYLNSMHTHFEKTGRVTKAIKEWIAEQLFGPGYLHMMPEDDARKWVEEVAKKMKDGKTFRSILNSVKK